MSLAVCRTHAFESFKFSGLESTTISHVTLLICYHKHQVLYLCQICTGEKRWARPVQVPIRNNSKARKTHYFGTTYRKLFGELTQRLNTSFPYKYAFRSCHSAVGKVIYQAWQSKTEWTGVPWKRNSTRTETHNSLWQGKLAEKKYWKNQERKANFSKKTRTHQWHSVIMSA